MNLGLEENWKNTRLISPSWGFKNRASFILSSNPLKMLYSWGALPRGNRGPEGYRTSSSVGEEDTLPQFQGPLEFSFFSSTLVSYIVRNVPPPSGKGPSPLKSIEWSKIFEVMSTFFLHTEASDESCSKTLKTALSTCTWRLSHFCHLASACLPVAGLLYPPQPSLSGRGQQGRAAQQRRTAGPWRTWKSLTGVNEGTGS